MPNSKTKKLLTTYLRRLTNLAGNNRSIFLPKLSADQFIDLHDLTFLNGKNSFSIIQNLIAGKQQIIAAELDSRMKANNEASAKLKKLKRLDQFLFEERGTKDLHVGWLFVHGRFMDDTLVRCPLVYFPVELVLESGNWVLRPRENAEITFNKSFLLAYAFYNQTQPADDALDEDFDEADRDSAVFRTFIYQSLQRNNLEINFNPDNYRDELTAFRPFKKDEFLETTETGRLKLFPEAVLGIFPQAGSSLVPDYLQLMNEDRMSDIEEFFLDRTSRQPTETLNFLHEVREEKVYTVFPMDVWQENALKAVKQGHSLVVQGPPGTGKSQLISNLISDTIANQQRVLLVCQKRVALDVVYNRLKEKKLDDFVALVHDFKEDRRTLYQKMARQIERVDEFKSKNNSLDSIQLERRFYDTSRRIDQIVEELERFKKYLFDESECGTSIKQLYLLSDSTQPSVELKQELSYFRWPEAEAFKRRLKVFVAFAKRFAADDYPWKTRRSFATYTAGGLPELKRVVTEVFPWFSKLNQEIFRLIGSALTWHQCETFVERREQAEEMISLLADRLTYADFQHMVHEAEEDTSSLWLANMEKMIAECFDEEGPELTIAPAQLGQFQLALYRSMKSRRSLYGLIRWELFSRDKFLIKRTLVANGLENSKKGFRVLEARLDRRLNLEHNLSKLRGASWLRELPSFTSREVVTDFFARQQNAVKAKSIYHSLRGLRNTFNPALVDQQTFRTTLQEVMTRLDELPIKKSDWMKWLLPVQIEELTSNETLTIQLEQSLRSDFDALCEFDKLQESLTPHELLTVNKIIDKLSERNEAAALSLFNNSLCLAWIDYLEMKHPELRMVSSGKMELIESELQELIAEKESMSTEILLMRAREGVVDDIQVNRLNNRVTYRNLHHQLNKKKKIWPIRKIVSEFEDDLFKLAPCWLASPESVSSIFPMKELFDLVIFDEASQCYAERGIPAMYRGKRVVITGDPQQLQPSDLYSVRWDEESDDPDAEVHSLLDLGSRNLPQVVLRGHYRSKSPELIRFSNEHFYKNKLQLLPHCSQLNSMQSAITFEKVNGTWTNQSNTVEAKRILEWIVDLTGQGKEVGVVTFNAPQQSLINDLLDQYESDHEWTRPESLFVKNIENVQGDEKDVILFSIGYAPDEKGKLQTMFGSLNQAGGENRLNVAATRARERIILVSSIEWSDLQVEGARNEGPRLLQKYLKYAREVSDRRSQQDVVPMDGHEASWYLKSRIRSNLKSICHADENYAFSDFILKKDQLYFGLLHTDDELYYESLSSKSDHGLFPRLCQEKGWKHKMLFSRNWWADKEKFLNELGKFSS